MNGPPQVDGDGRPSPSKRRASRLVDRFRAADARDENRFERRALPHLLLSLLAGGPLALLASVGLLATRETEAAPQRAVDLQAQAAVDRLVADGPEATIEVVRRGPSALPALIAALGGGHEPVARRRVSEALRLVTETSGGSLRQPDIDALEELARADPDPTVRADCAAARARVSIFWR